MQALRETYCDEVVFLMIYLREAHPNDGLIDDVNLREGIDIPQHTGHRERAAAARAMCRKLALDMPVLVDDLRNTTEENYSAFPDRLYLVGRDGRVAYKGSVLAILFQLVGGVRQSMGYCGCATIDELKEKAEFVEITSAGMRESHVHDVQITKEAPNYRSE